MPATTGRLQGDSRVYYDAARDNNIANSDQNGALMPPSETSHIAEVAGVAVPSGSRFREGGMHESAGGSMNMDEGTQGQQGGTHV